jgi:hypothetical protein
MSPGFIGMVESGKLLTIGGARSSTLIGFGCDGRAPLCLIGSSSFQINTAPNDHVASLTDIATAPVRFSRRLSSPSILARERLYRATLTTHLVLSELEGGERWVGLRQSQWLAV